MGKPFFSCRECKDRKVGCHSTCEKYKRDVEEARDEKTKIFKAASSDRVYLNYVTTRSEKNSKHKKR